MAKGWQTMHSECAGHAMPPPPHTRIRTRVHTHTHTHTQNADAHGSNPRQGDRGGFPVVVAHLLRQRRVVCVGDWRHAGAVVPGVPGNGGDGGHLQQAVEGSGSGSGSAGGGGRGTGGRDRLQADAEEGVCVRVRVCVCACACAGLGLGGGDAVPGVEGRAGGGCASQLRGRGCAASRPLPARPCPSPRPLDPSSSHVFEVVCKEGPAGRHRRTQGGQRGGQGKGCQRGARRVGREGQQGVVGRRVGGGGRAGGGRDLHACAPCLVGGRAAVRRPLR